MERGRGGELKGREGREGGLMTGRGIVGESVERFRSMDGRDEWIGLQGLGGVLMNAFLLCRATRLLLVISLNCEEVIVAV